MSDDALLYGRNPVMCALRAGKRPARKLYYLAGAKGLDPLLQAAGGIAQQACDRNRLDRMAQGGAHQGVVLEAGPLPTPTLNEWLDHHAVEGVVVVLDEVEDPHNFGAIVRSAAGFGARAVVFGRDRAAPLSAAAAKAAAGTMETVDLVQGGNLARGVRQLRQAGYWTTALTMERAEPLWYTDLSGATALVVGNEGRGVRKIVLDQCDKRVRIPISGAVESLNASVSAAVVLAECARQRAQGASR